MRTEVMIVAGLELTRTEVDPFLAHGLAGLRAGVVKLCRLPDDDGTGTDDEYLRRLGHKFDLFSCDKLRCEYEARNRELADNGPRREDMAMADATWKMALYSPCIFHCQQAIEKILKAGLVKRGLAVPKTHDLPDLAQRLGLALDPEQSNFLDRLTEQYLPTRYGDLRIEYPRDVAERYFESTKGLYTWLRQRLS